MSNVSDNLFLGHPIRTLCAIVEPECRMVDAATLATLYQAESRIQQARAQAAKQIKHSRQRAHRNRQMLKQQQEAQFAAQQQTWQQESELAQQQALHSTIQWLVAEEQLEQKLYQQALSTACQWSMKALQQWESSIDWAALLSARIEEMERKLVRERDLTIRLAPGEFAQKFQQQNALKENGFTDPLKVIIDDQLSAKQAIVGNALVSVTVDLQKEFADVMTQLGHVFQHMETESGA